MTIQYDIKNPLLTAAATLRGSLDAAREANIELQPSLTKFGWSERSLKAPKDRIAYHTVVEFLNDVAMRNHCPAFGFLVGQYQPSDNYGTALRVLKLCATPRKALELAFRYHLLVSEVSIWNLTEEGGYATLQRVERVSYDGDQRQIHELALTTVYALTLEISGRQLDLTEVHFMHSEPKHAAEMQRYFGCPVRFDQVSCALIYPTHTLDTPFPTADATILDAAVSYLETQDTRYHLDDALSHKVYVHIKQNLGTNKCSLEAIAQLLGQSPRSIQRELSKTGYSFRELVNEARLSAAEHYLKSSNIAAGDLAEILGYRNPSAFSRAFKKQTKLSPDHWRKAYKTT